MSFFPGKDPAPGDAPAADAIDLIVVPRTVDVGHFAVRGEPIHGLQCWVALPASDEETEPGFSHHDSAALPLVTGEGKTARVVAGSTYGARSPVPTRWDTLFVDVALSAGATLPVDADTEE